MTERNRTEAALHASQALMQSVLEQTPIMLIATDRHGVVTLSHGKALASLGILPDELTGRSIFDFSSDAPALTDLMRRALAGQAASDTVVLGGRTFVCTCTPMLEGETVVVAAS